MKLSGNLKKIYMIGIGGIGMSALARYFNRQNIVVSGYDKTATELTEKLVSEGIDIHYKPDITHPDPDTDLVIYTPAIPAAHPELQKAFSSDIPVLKRSEALGAICSGHKTIAVAGTHGKTTTTAMIAHLLASAGKKVTAFLGGISVNYHSNFLCTEDDGFYLVEADEYDRSFLTLHPHIAVITSIRADHLDIYGDVKHMHNSFCLFASQVDPQGCIVLHQSLNIGEPAAKILTYDSKKGGDAGGGIIQIKDATYHFRMKLNGTDGFDVALQTPGIHNIENAIAAACVARLAGLTDLEIQKGLSSFRGVRRRFEYVIRKHDLVMIDDYAHHPDELRACIGTAKALYPNKKITGVFQPHLFSRTRDLADGFVTALALLDQLLLLDIYPAREEPIKGIDAQWLLEKIPVDDKTTVGKNELPDRLIEAQPEVILMMGAGDIDAMVSVVKSKLLGL